MDQTVIEKLEQYACIVRQTMNVKKVILYGSHARETAGTGSDIDVAIIVDGIQGDYLESHLSMNPELFTDISQFNVYNN